MTDWVYPHRDLDEPAYPDGSRVLRPAVPIIVAAGVPAVLGVVDSGSPASVADATLFDLLGVNVDSDEPLYEIPLTVGGRFAPTPVFEVRLWLQPAEARDEPLAWTLPLGARRVWKSPFGVLLGQRGWFDRFPTRIDATTSTVRWLPPPGFVVACSQRSAGRWASHAIVGAWCSVRNCGCGRRSGRR